MSNDLLLLSLDQVAQALATLRQHAPLFAATVRLEDAGVDAFDALPRALPDYVRASAGAVGVVDSVPFSTGIAGHTYGRVVFAEDVVPEDRRGEAFRAFLPAARRLSGLVRELPPRTRERLGVREVVGAPVDDWVWLLFHLAWHFPDHFARGVVRRERLLQTNFGPRCEPEEWVQLNGLISDAHDQFPGLVFSRFPHELDLVTATGYAIELFRRALQETAFRIADPVREQLRLWHREFVSVGELYARQPGSAGDLDVRVLRLDSSFHTPPATRWADYRMGGAIQRTFLLGHLRAVKEVCVLRGPSVTDFVTRADRVGALLPAWPDHRPASVLEDAAGWLRRVARRRELQSEQLYFVTEDKTPPHGQPVPRTQVVEQYWTSTRMSGGGLVTDHRGNVERWLGFIFHVLKEFDPDAVEVRTF
ncbi:MAG: hypothetical protein K2V38_04840, partial [Gemmataceae bacterium]|nr:hypothetical protein [Gemmataceae bacterium]